MAESDVIVKPRDAMPPGGLTLAAPYYVDVRRATLHHRAAPLIGRLMRDLTADWDVVAMAVAMIGPIPGMLVSR